MSYEDEVRRQLEIAASQQASGNCPVEDEVDATFGFREEKKGFKKRLAASGASKGFRKQATLKRGGGKKTLLSTPGTIHRKKQ